MAEKKLEEVKAAGERLEEDLQREAKEAAIRRGNELIALEKTHSRNMVTDKVEGEINYLRHLAEIVEEKDSKRLAFLSENKEAEITRLAELFFQEGMVEIKKKYADSSSYIFKGV